MSQDQSLERQGANTLLNVLKRYEKQFKNVMPKHMSVDRWTWLCINSIRQNPKLCEVTPASFINAVLLANNVGLEIRARSAYLVPFGRECQLLIDYRGKMELARRAGVGAITLELARQGDEFDVWQDENGPHFIHRFLNRERGEISHAYMSASVNGSRQIEVMTLAEVEKIRKRSKSGAAKPVYYYKKELPGLDLEAVRKMDWESLPFGHPYRVPWITDYEQMARKTVMHRGANYLPQTPELMTSQDIDNAVLGEEKMPAAPEMMEFLNELDPADNHPLVDIPETAEERKEAQQRIVDEKLNQPPQSLKDHEDWPDDPEAPALGKWIRVKGTVYHRSDDLEPWKPWKKGTK